MGKITRPPFQAALDRYRRARSRVVEKFSERALLCLDEALDRLMAVPSPSVGAFGEKLKILNSEYGLAAQPRHVGAIYADVALLATLYAESLFQAWPNG